MNDTNVYVICFLGWATAAVLWATLVVHARIHRLKVRLLENEVEEMGKQMRKHMPIPQDEPDEPDKRALLDFDRDPSVPKPPLTDTFSKYRALTDSQRAEWDRLAVKGRPGQVGVEDPGSVVGWKWVDDPSRGP